MIQVLLCHGSSARHDVLRALVSEHFLPVHRFVAVYFFVQSVPIQPIRALNKVAIRQLWTVVEVSSLGLGFWLRRVEVLMAALRDMGLVPPRFIPRH